MSNRRVEKSRACVNVKYDSNFEQEQVDDGDTSGRGATHEVARGDEELSVVGRDEMQ